MTHRHKHGLAALAVALLVVTAVVAAVAGSGSSVAKGGDVGEFPTALAGHLDQLR